MDYARSAILGGVDGVVTTFAIVVGGLFTATPHRVVTIVGTSSLVADGVSMGVSEFLSNADDPRAVRLGLVCCASFVACGGASLVIFVAGHGAVLGSASVSLLVLLLLGVGRGRAFQDGLLRGMLMTTLLGGLASGVAVGTAAAAAALTAQ